MSRMPRASDVARLLLAWAISSVALILADAVLPGLEASSPWRLVAAAAVAGVFGVLLRPVLTAVAATIGWVAVAVLAIAGQAVVMHLALEVVPGIEAGSFWTAVAATWIAATAGTLLTWFTSAGTDESFAATLQHRSRRRVAVADPDVDGVVFVQLDGVSFPIARWALQSGTMPTLRRWVESGSHRLAEWTVQLPCTTPASQQGILQGTIEGVPAFRWYDRELGRVLVANRPADAAIIEERASNGHGLLADDGVSISNLFSGDAARSLMTMSQVSLTRASRDTRHTVARFVVRPDGFARSIARTTSEVVRERFQARQQRRRAVEPRVHRSWTFALLRAVSNGVLRDLNTAMVVEEMQRGTHSIYVDYVDYDEVAHHAGANRLEALRVLESLDRVLAVLETLAATAARRYHLVVLSDHGQSQGSPFATAHGTSLGSLCEDLARQRVESVEENVESWGRAGALLDDLAGEGSLGSQTASRAASRVRDRTEPGAHDEATDLIVLGSGNLGLVYVPGSERLMLEELEERWPRLVPGLAAHPGIGFVAALSRDDGPVVIGAEGSHRLRDGAVVGTDPLAAYADHAAWALQRALAMETAPELYVNSTVDPSSEEVAAFEGLVGCHGGLGGWQDRGMLVSPVALDPVGVPIRGADALHRALVSMLETLGHRRGLVPPSPHQKGPTR